jgi:proteic killer suppression protein
MLENSIDLADLRIPPSNRLEKLQGSDYYSIRINRLDAPYVADIV